MRRGRRLSLQAQYYVRGRGGAHENSMKIVLIAPLARITSDLSDGARRCRHAPPQGFPFLSRQSPSRSGFGAVFGEEPGGRLAGYLEST